MLSLSARLSKIVAWLNVIFASFLIILTVTRLSGYVKYRILSFLTVAVIIISAALIFLQGIKRVKSNFLNLKITILSFIIFQNNARQMQFFIIVMILSFILALYRIYANFQLEHTRLDPNTKENIELAMGFIFGFIPFSILETPIRLFTRYDIPFYDSYSLIGATLTTSIYTIFTIITIKCYHRINRDREGWPHVIAAC